jgi:spore germination protein KC
MVGRINNNVTRGVLWLKNEIDTAVVTVTPKEAKEGQVSLNLLRAHTELIPKIENKRWKITVKAVSDDEIVHNGTNLDLMNPKFTEMIEQQLKEDIERSMKTALNQLQKNKKADIIGFAQAFHRKYPQEWKKAKERWSTIFPEVEVSFDIRANVRRPGMLTAPAGSGR